MADLIARLEVYSDDDGVLSVKYRSDDADDRSFALLDDLLDGQAFNAAIGGVLISVTPRRWEVRRYSSPTAYAVVSYHATFRDADLTYAASVRELSDEDREKGIRYRVRRNAHP